MTVSVDSKGRVVVPGIQTPLASPIPWPNTPTPTRPLNPNWIELPDGRVVDRVGPRGPQREKDLLLSELIKRDTADLATRRLAGAAAFQARVAASEAKTLDFLWWGTVGQRLHDPAPRGTVARPIIRQPKIEKRE